MADDSAPVPFVNLHQHTEYSILDGLAHPTDAARRARELGQSALAITDHGTLAGIIPFVKACRNEGIKPIVGCELYVTAGARGDRPKKGEDNYELTAPTYHLIALAQNQQGYQNLKKLSSLAYLEGFWRRPRVDHELLERYNEGIFVLSGCLGGELAQSLVAGDEDRARAVIDFYKTTFPGRYALEIHNHGIDDEDLVRRALIQLSREYELPLVATADNHFIDREQASLHELMLCIQTGSLMSDPNRFKFDGHGYHLPSAQEMLELFAETPEAISNAVTVAESCELELGSSTVQLPDFPHMEKGLSAPEMLTKLTWEGIARKYGDEVTLEIEDRVRSELEVINGAGFPNYFLIVWDLVHHAEESGISVAPGRGSAAGSIVSYALGITSLDPIEHELLFERFLNAERVSMPDIDIDFEDRGLADMIEYARQTYGADRVARIITIDTLGPKEACRRVAKARGVEYANALSLTRLIPEGVETLDDAFAHSTELGVFVRDNPWTHQIIDEASKLVGYVSGSSINAAGVVVTREPLLDEIPLQFPSGAAHANTVISQFDKDILSELNFLKIDFLGNSNLAIIKDALRMVEEEYGLSVGMEQIPADDQVTMKMLGQGDTVGVYQMEGRGPSGILREMDPTSLADIAAANALNRPGPLQGIVEEARVVVSVDPETGAELQRKFPAKTVVAAFMERRRHPERVVAPIPEVEEILRETQGLIVYQDQVMQIANRVAGYSLGEADILRAAMGKKNLEKMAHEKEKFVSGCVGNGVTEENATKLWDYIDKFAGYGFNKAHAYAYGKLAYYTAWVKCHYPLEFTTALCTSRGGNFEAAKEAAKTKRATIESAIRDAKAHGITVVNPDINHSQVDFSIRSRVRQTISYGLSHIKKVGELPARSIVEEREANGAYGSFVDLVERNQVRGLSMAAVRTLWKKAKTAVDFPGLEAMVEQGVVSGPAIKLAESAITEREQNGPYKSFAQVLERNGLKTGTNQATWESLIRSGACDEFGPRHELLAALPEVLKSVTKLKSSDNVQLELLVNQERKRQVVHRQSPKVLTIQDLEDEEALLGVPLSGHRMQVYQQQLSKWAVMTMDEVLSAPALPPQFRVAGMLKAKHYTKTKRDGKPMAILKLEDASGDFDVLVFESGLEDLRQVLDNGSGPLMVRGQRLKSRNPNDEQDHLTVSARQVSRLETPAISKPKPELEPVAELVAPEPEVLALAL